MAQIGVFALGGLQSRQVSLGSSYDVTQTNRCSDRRRSTVGFKSWFQIAGGRALDVRGSRRFVFKPSVVPAHYQHIMCSGSFLALLLFPAHVPGARFLAAVERSFSCGARGGASSAHSPPVFKPSGVGRTLPFCLSQLSSTASAHYPRSYTPPKEPARVSGACATAAAST